MGKYPKRAPKQQAVGTQTQELCGNGGRVVWEGFLERGSSIWDRIWTWGYGEDREGLRQRWDVGGTMFTDCGPMEESHRASRYKSGHVSVSPGPEFTHSICRLFFLTVTELPKGRHPREKFICSSGSQQGCSHQTIWEERELLLLGWSYHISGQIQGAAGSAQHSEGLPASHTSLEWLIPHSVRLPMNLTQFYLYIQTWCFTLHWLFQNYNHHINKGRLCFGWNFIKTCLQFQKTSLLMATPLGAFVLPKNTSVHICSCCIHGDSMPKCKQPATPLCLLL